MGGHCLPVDPFYLTWRAREFDMPTEFIELAGEVNQAMPYFCVEKIAGRAERPLEAGARLEDRDHRRLVQAGRRRPARVARAQDHPAPARARRRDLATATRTWPSCPSTTWRREPLEQELEACDCAVIVTHHPGLDFDKVLAAAPLVVDFRGVTRGKTAPNLVRL